MGCFPLKFLEIKLHIIEDESIKPTSDYAKSDIIWNQLLAGHLPSVDAKILPQPFQNAAIAADVSGAFPRDKVDQRQRLFFEAFKTVWAQV
jgi:hypothetical protein